MLDNYPKDIINEINVGTHINQWLKSNQSFEATNTLTNETDKVNRENTRSYKQNIFDFASTLGIELQTRHDKIEDWKDQEERNAFLLRQTFKSSTGETESLGSQQVKEHGETMSAFAEHERNVTDSLNSSGEEASGADTSKYYNTHTAKPSRLTDEKISMVMGGLKNYLDKALSDPERVWTLPDGNKFNISNWSEPEAAWAREQAMLNYFENNGIINLRDVPVAYLSPYLKNLYSHQQAWKIKQSKAISGRESQILRSSTFAETHKSGAKKGDVGGLLEIYRFTTDANGVRLGRIGAMEQYKADLKIAVAAGQITADEAYDLYSSYAIGHRWKGHGKTLAQEYPRYSVNSIQGQAFHKELMKADNEQHQQRVRFARNSMDKKVQSFLSSECGRNYESTDCQKKVQDLVKEAEGIEGYSSTSLNNWVTRAESPPTDLQVEETKAALDAAIQGDFFFPDTKIGGHPVQDLINSLPAADQKAYWTALGKPEIFENEAFKNGLKGTEEIVLSATGGLDSRAVKSGNSRNVMQELAMVYRRQYRKLMASPVGPIDPVTKKPTERYTEMEAARDALNFTREHFNINGGDRSLKNEDGRYWLHKSGENYANFGNFLTHAADAPINDVVGGKTNVAVDKLLKSGLYTKDSILDNNKDIMFTEDKLKDIKNRFDNQSGYIIPPKVRSLALQLGVNPIHLINRQLKAYGIPLLESPVTPWFELGEPKRLEALNRNATSENSIRFIRQFNQKTLNLNTIPYSTHFSEKLPNDQKPFAGALLDVMNKDGGTNMQDVKDTEEIISRFTLADGSLDVPNFMNTLESLGVDVTVYRRELYKYLGKSALNRYTMPLTPSAQRLLNQYYNN